MATATTYQELIALCFAESVYSWGGTDYSTMLLNTGINVPDSVSLDSKIEKGVGNRDGFSGTHEFIFITPLPYDFISIMDGTIQGNVKVGVRVPSSHGTDFLKITKVEISFNAVDVEGNVRVLVDYFTIWTGSIEAGSSETKTKGIMFWATVSDAAIQSDERLQCAYRVSYSGYDYLGNEVPFYLQLYTGKSTQDTMINLPFVMS